ncbi:hypothetical protein H632_c1p1 [Helicosporidium sp. ATCC 50920]|nr:hypothetical protein H632_c1p1 [Helicosporidium sp. ATCC 50920]|eukprot:KDD77190.1 hypothetical protein H632_c1p1 [Helicosporidium sp. ATCC 50920]
MIIGWTYFSAWSISFYPQIWLNTYRKSVVGLSMDFQLLNMLGFGAYAIYNSALYWNPVLRAQYALQHGGSYPAIHANDVFFALHASAATMVTLFQCFTHDRGDQRISRFTISFVLVSVAIALAFTGVLMQSDRASCVEGCDPNSMMSWLNLLYYLSYIKLVVSMVKYIPQVAMNHWRGSTKGWNVWNVILDFEGGVLSLSQQLLDNYVCEDWSAITGNPVKFALGLVSVVFDIIFVGQHIAFGDEEESVDALLEQEEQGLLTLR